MNRQRILEIYRLGVLLVVLFSPAAVFPETKLVPSLNLTGEYDDNVFFSRDNIIDDFLFAVRPSINLEYQSELLSVNSLNGVEIDRYADEKGLDTEKYDLELNGVYRFLPRWNGSWLLSYIKDTTLDRELTQETGFLIERANRERYEASGGLSYELSQVSQVGINYSFTRKEYELPTLVDYDRHLVGLSYNRKLKNEIDTVSILPSYSSQDSDLNKLDQFILGLAWDHPFSSIMKVYALLGVRHTDVDFKQARDDQRDWGVIADVSLTRRGDISLLSLGLRRDVRVSGRGNVVEVTRLYLRTGYSLTERLNIGLFSQLFVNTGLGESFSLDNRFFELRPSIGYRITENHDLVLSYRYANDYNNNISDHTADRNQVWLTLNLNFPRNL